MAAVQNEIEKIRPGKLLTVCRVQRRVLLPCRRHDVYDHTRKNKSVSCLILIQNAFRINDNGPGRQYACYISAHKQSAARRFKSHYQTGPTVGPRRQWASTTLTTVYTCNCKWHITKREYVYLKWLTAKLQLQSEQSVLRASIRGPTVTTLPVVTF